MLRKERWRARVRGAVGQHACHETITQRLRIRRKPLRTAEAVTLKPVGQHGQVFALQPLAHGGHLTHGHPLNFSGKYFTIAEGALWLGLYGVDRHATALQDDARRYAAIHAGTTLQGKDDQYFVDISNFHDVYVYNDQVLRDRDHEKVYDPMGADYWSWDSEANRNTFRDQRVSADKMFNNTRFVVAAIAVNHVVSAINAARLAFSHNRKLDALGSIDVRAGLLGMDGRPDGIVVSVAHRF